MTSKRHHFHLLSSRQRFSFVCVCDLMSQFSWFFWFYQHEESSISYLSSFFSSFLSSRSLSLRQFWLSSRQRDSKSRRHQIDDRSHLFHLFRQRDEINHAVFVSKSKRRCLNELIQRQRTSRIFSIIHNLCCAKRATRISLWARFSWVIWISQTL